MLNPALHMQRIVENLRASCRPGKFAGHARGMPSRTCASVAFPGKKKPNGEPLGFLDTAAEAQPNTIRKDAQCAVFT
jgi:hypothetical protein